MITKLEEKILTELDYQSLNSSLIAFIMKSLDSVEKQSLFLDYLLYKRGIIIPIPDLFDELKLLSK